MICFNFVKYLNFEFFKLEYLYLDFNKLTQLPESVFRSAAKLEFLRINYYSQLEILDKILSNLTRLQYLFIDHNSLTRLPSLYEQTQLKFLRADYNQISLLPNTCFNVLNRLDFLDLSNNQLTRLVDYWTSFQMLLLTLWHL